MSGIQVNKTEKISQTEKNEKRHWETMNEACCPHHSAVGLAVTPPSLCHCLDNELFFIKLY